MGKGTCYTIHISTSGSDEWSGASAQHDDYRLLPGSRALALGFESIDLSRIGIREKP